MKNITFLILGIMLFSFNLSEAQIKMDTIYIRVKKQAPKKEAYKFEEVRYYYYPNLQAYFDTKIAMYIYKENGEWIKSETLDPTLRGYSIKNGQYVMLKGFIADNPEAYIDEHKEIYPADFSSRPRKPQPVATKAPTITPKETIASID